MCWTLGLVAGMKQGTHTRSAYTLEVYYLHCTLRLVPYLARDIIFPVGRRLVRACSGEACRWLCGKACLPYSHETVSGVPGTATPARCSPHSIALCHLWHHNRVLTPPTPRYHGGHMLPLIMTAATTTKGADEEDDRLIMPAHSFFVLLGICVSGPHQVVLGATPVSSLRFAPCGAWREHVVLEVS